MILVIDVGNTQLKLGVFNNKILTEKILVPYNNWIEDTWKIIKKHPIKHLVVASVGKLDKESFAVFQEKVAVFFVNHQSKFPFQNLYKTPKTLGIDRMVLAAGAVFQYPKKNRLVIDAGTCITYDFVDDENNYLGGAIAPGIRLRYEAMHNFTAKLPLLSKQSIDFTIGNSTENAMHSGVVNGIVFEIEGFINSFCQNQENFIIILTGGDAEFLAKQLKNTIFANENFLLESLNLIYRYNQND